MSLLDWSFQIWSQKRRVNGWAGERDNSKMGKEESREVMGKVYREFSRQKYNKYKHQFPKMRESEIVSKIIREWDNLDPNAKLRLKKVYRQNRALPNDLSDSETAKKSEVAGPTQHGSNKKEDEVANQLPQPEENIFTPEKEHKEGELQAEENKRELSASGKATPKRKCINKATGSDYLTFFRHYYQKYSQEHPRWKPCQISKIIKLLWRKNKLSRPTSKFRKGKLERSTKAKKPLSGRTAFKKLKNLNAKDSSRLWKHLPLESRRYWEREGQGRTKEVQREHKLKLKPSNDGDGNSLDFMSKVIMG